MEVAICMMVIANICLSAYALFVLVTVLQVVQGLLVASTSADVRLYAQQGCGGMILSAVALMLDLIS